MFLTCTINQGGFRWSIKTHIVCSPKIKSHNINILLCSSSSKYYYYLKHVWQHPSSSWQCALCKEKYSAQNSCCIYNDQYIFLRILWVLKKHTREIFTCRYKYFIEELKLYIYKLASFGTFSFPFKINRMKLRHFINWNAMDC